MKQNTYQQIITLLDEDFHFAQQLKDVIHDLEQLYHGQWPEYESCQTPYHTYGHALDVTLASLRMASGWNKSDMQNITADRIMALGIASLFHDCGYIKDRGDTIGSGGKYSFDHTDRSQRICEFYLLKKKYQRPQITLILDIIATTDFNSLPDLEVYQSSEDSLIAKMVASADLVAQMADIQYMDNLENLYAEFNEAYIIHGTEKLRAQGVQVFDTLESLLSSTTLFYKKTVLPRLDFFGRMDQYLTVYFADGRNPYFENIIANLSAQMQAGQIKWQRLGEILRDLDFVSESTINKALEKQKQRHKKTARITPISGTALQDRLFRWANKSSGSSQLGDILMQMNAVNPTILRKGILHQLIPQDLLRALRRDELIFLLHIAILVQNTKQDPWVFNQALQMINEAIGCTRTALYLANSEQNELVCTLFSGGHEPPCRRLSMDKGLSGWVYSHGRTAFLQKGMIISHHDPQVSTKITEDIGSLLGVPLYIEGILVGVIELSNKEVDHFTSHDADIMTVVAHIFAGLLQSVSQEYEPQP